jgi:hypothetical protein
VYDKHGYTGTNNRGSFCHLSCSPFAAYHAACSCGELGLQNLIMEGDAKQIVEAINSSTSTWSCFGHLIDDTRRILSTFLR